MRNKHSVSVLLLHTLIEGMAKRHEIILITSSLRPLPNNPMDHTRSCHTHLCGLTENINLDLVASTPLRILKIQNIVPLGNKGFGSCHRNTGI